MGHTVEENMSIIVFIVSFWILLGLGDNFEYADKQPQRLDELLPILTQLGHHPALEQNHLDFRRGKPVNRNSI